MPQSSEVLLSLEAKRKKLDSPSTWCKYRFHGTNGAECLSVDLGGQDVRGAVIASIHKLFPQYGGSIVLFNDSVYTTHNNVIAVLDDAIETERAKCSATK